MKYKVSGNYLEYLKEIEIEAKDEEEAKSKYYELWAEGNVPDNGGDLDIDHIEEA